MSPEWWCPECEMTTWMGECPGCGFRKPDPLWDAPWPTAESVASDLAAARVRFAEAFLRYRVNAKSDNIAFQQAIVETGDEITVLQTRLDVAKGNRCACQSGSSS